MKLNRDCSQPEKADTKPPWVFTSARVSVLVRSDLTSANLESGYPRELKDSGSELVREEITSTWGAADSISARRFRVLRVPTLAEVPSEVPEEQSSNIEFNEIESGSVSQMVDSSSATLLEEISSKSKKPLIWPWVLGLSIFLLIVLAATNSPVWIYCVLVPLCAGGLVGAVHADKLRKTVVLFYELEPHIEQAFQNLHNAFDVLRGCFRMWHIESRGNITTTYDWKVNAGASALVKRKAIAPQAGSPPYFQCNISIPVLPAGRQRLYFLPDRILVWDTNGVGAVGFEQLDVSSGEQRFIEGDGVPSDTRVVDKTWRYVNKKGGPARRFNDNREIPIVIYEAIMLTSKSGLQELFQASRTGIGSTLNSAVKQMASAIAQRAEPKTEDGYIKCPCNNCDIFIEFPEHGLGQTIACPHCGMETVLFKPAALG